jgi:hypothetical protein
VRKAREATRPGADTKIKIPGGWDTGPGPHGTINRNGRTSAQYRDVTEVGNRDPGRHVTEVRTIRWQPGCECDAGGPVPCTVLDPFAGAGTTGVACRKLSRSFIGLELSETYCEMARRRIDNPEPETAIADAPGQLMLEGFDG